MESKIAHAWDDDFNYKEEVEIFPNANGEYVLPTNATFISLPEPNWKPKFDHVLDDWVETSTEEERENIMNPLT
ncbi:hypothetical protein ACQKCU_25000 [Heyndrickxia sporothermodurans]